MSQIETIGKDVTLYPGDCLDVLTTLPENSCDACVTDPPYHLTSIVKRFGAEDAAPCKVGKTGAYARASSGFMGKQWDGGNIAFQPETWAVVYRVLKPGAHLIAFSGTRTYHRMVCAIEDAGFEVRDQIGWAFGSGFPKSHDISKAIDRAAGAEREVVGQHTQGFRAEGSGIEGWRRPAHSVHGAITASATDAAKEWDGWGTALKPAWEPCVVARKPLSEPTIAANVLKWGTGALNIDGCRVGIDNGDANQRVPSVPYQNGVPLPTGNSKGRPVPNLNAQGRWPANVIHDGSDEVVGAFPETGISSGGSGEASKKTALAGHVYGQYSGATLGQNAGGLGDSGSAARFFYTAKADSDDRLGSKHPTVKPVDLIQYLVRLVTPKGGTCLDPFAGTGTLGEACIREGMKAVLIEREEEYQEDIRRRMKLAMAGPDERAREAAKAKNPNPDLGPLFAEWQ